MKNRFIFILLSLLLMANMTFAASPTTQKLFSDVAKMPDVESVFVGGAILKLANGTQKITGGNKYTRRIKNIDAIEVISCDSPESVPAVAAACQKIIDRLNLEVILESTENKDAIRNATTGAIIEKGGVEKSIIYGGPIIEGESKMKNMIVVNQSADEFQLVYIKGDIDISDVVGGW